MKQVRRHVLLWYEAREMYALVNDVEAYPSFLPWCARVEILARHDDGVTARLHVAYSGLRTAFTTRTVGVADRSVRIELVDGPFSRLDGLWQFVPLPVPEGSASAPAACRIEFELSYSFANFVLEAAVGPVFDRIADTFVDSFVRRAEHVLGAR